MVEGNDQHKNETGEGGQAPKRRGGLFGGRRARGKHLSAGAANAPEPVNPPEPAPTDASPAAASTADDATAGASASPTQATTQPRAGAATEADPATDAATEADRPASAEGAEADAAEAATEPDRPEFEPIPDGLTTTSLIFRAPPVLKVVERPERDARPDRDAPGDDDEESASSVRRRTRRRSGEESRGQSDDPANTVVRVRKPREPELITEPQKVKGSTRLEAKKQRRRDGRDAGRRRAIITEAEFLARRESVDRQMIVRQKGGRIQIGVLEDGVLVEHYVARNQDASLIGNVYLGRVQNVLPSMEAAFVDIGRGRNAVLYSGEVDWDAAAENGEKNQPRRIELALKPGDRVLVQVTKDPVGHKGARLTSQVSLPGRYLVYVPNGSMNGISRKLPDTERARLKKILKEVLPENVGVIVRTAAEGATDEQLTLDVNRLTAQWADISAQLEKVQAPALLHSEPDLLVKIVRDVFNEDFQKMIIEGDEARQTIERYLRAVAPDLLERVEAYAGERDSFDEFRISEQIEKALDRKVWLPSGGSLVIDRTEAMTVVDVNTGKFVGSGGNLEETVTKNNLEAAEEIVRQLRLRDIGGIIVVDFIDMVLESNRDLVLRRLVECLSRDRTKHQVAEVTSLGLVQMTRKKLGLGLLESFSEPCEVCAGRGIIVHHEPILRHRPQQQPERRRGRGGQQQPQQREPQAQPEKTPHPGAHEITEDVKHALAKIAASTIAHPPAADAGGAPATDAPAAAAATESGPRSGRRGRRRASKGQTVTVLETTAREASDQGGDDAGAVGAAPAQPAASGEPAAANRGGSGEVAGAAGAEPAAVDLPELPDLPAPRERQRPVVDPDSLLGSVLDALPAPKQPGEGRARSRRVSTAAVSTAGGAPVILRIDAERSAAAGSDEPASGSSES
ncbi:Rne/Rng family ribonuclease [Agromyces sp. CFH 90414]|uniref:Ribonuclease E n=1 Tax=Agromyces agglutinans TaxID=2662258 RepID=A0A6I2F433_9MICO|nr:Rne/Rng family ribonuclease [Agromyces agglutinans]MRG58477.1 Rne/Rng family ribonuclease [Agromyces agglutinans]